jgi:hypothetical protein
MGVGRAAKRSVNRRHKKKTAKRAKPQRRLPLPQYIARWGVPPKGHPRRGAYERSKVGKARKAAAAKGQATRERKIEMRLRDLMNRWGTALEKARDLGTASAWRALRRIDAKRARAVEKAEKHKRWRAILRHMAEGAAEVFDVEADTLLQ